MSNDKFNAHTHTEKKWDEESKYAYFYSVTFESVFEFCDTIINFNYRVFWRKIVANKAFSDIHSQNKAIEYISLKTAMNCNM